MLSQPVTIPFICPHCGQHTSVEPRHAGHSGPCVSCGNTITIPTSDGVDLPSSAPLDPTSRRPWWINAGMILGGITAVTVLGIVAFSILQPAFRAAREAARCSACESNLNRIALALEDYYVDHGHYPPAIEYDENGQPKHSWRVLLLPYLGPEGERVHDLYDMTQPWNGPTNSLLVRQMPAAYQCPSDVRTAVGETSYLAVVGPRTVLSDGERPTTREDITDPGEETLVVIESANSTTNWLQPKDIRVDQLRAGLNSQNASSPGSNHSQGVNALMVDGSIARLPETTPDTDLRAMVTIDGDEFIESLDDLAY